MPTINRKSTRLNSSHVKISYAVFCLKKKINRKRTRKPPPAQTHVNLAPHAIWHDRITSPSHRLSHPHAHSPAAPRRPRSQFRITPTKPHRSIMRAGPVPLPPPSQRARRLDQHPTPSHEQNRPRPNEAAP